MDGRRFRKWFVFGCLLVAAAGGNRGAKAPWGQTPKDALPVTGVPIAPPNATTKSMWGGSKSQLPPAMQAEMIPESNKPASAAAIVAIADVRLQAAFDEKTLPGS